MGDHIIQSYKVLIGLEIHVQLATRSKMFTGAANGPGGGGGGVGLDAPNSRVDPQVLGLPGTLPVMNRRAVEYSIMAGLALGCTIARHTKWDRKSYYYPDLPKNYQISQYDLPLCHDGGFEIADDTGNAKSIRIRRAHLEEDAGKLLHEAPGGYKIDHSIVDLNRAGTPLLEIVTEPDFATPGEVTRFGQELQKLVQFLGVSEARMQMGQMRFEPNINVHITDAAGTVHRTAITEIKNLNSFSVLERSTAYEISRQIEVWKATGSLGRKSTYGWDESTGTTFHQRDKEDAHDYRYFPDPDLVPVEVSEEWLSELKAAGGELPAARRRRYATVYGLSMDDAESLGSSREIGDFFEEAVSINNSPKRIANLILNALGQMSNKYGKRIGELGIEPARLASVAGAIDAGKAAPGDAVAIFERTGNQHINAESLEQRLVEIGLRRISDAGPIDAAIDDLIAQNPKSLQDYKAGTQARRLGALVGMVMKSGKGLNPKVVQERLKAKIGT